MATAEKLDNIITEAEYLEGEGLADVRHEYVNGYVYAMAGSSKRHNRIAGNIYRRLSEMPDTDCESYIGDIKVRINEGKSYYYPDVVVGCDESDDNDDYYLEKPCLLVEVLSPSTERKDGTEKLLAYQMIESLQAYLLVDQDKCNVRMISKLGNGHWAFDTYDDMDDVVPISCPEMSLRVSDIYESVVFDEG